MSSAARRIADLVGRTPLLLHFDINRTIIQVDPAGGKSLVDILNNNVATESFGRVVDGAWQLAAGPTDAVDAAVAAELVSYDDFVDSLHPKPPGMDALPPQEARALWAEVSEKRRLLKKIFTAPGQPGEHYRPLVDTQLHQMRRPGGGPTDFYYIIPAFFRTVNELAEADVVFSIIFRTFGHDLAEVLRDWDAFVSGTHACQCSPRVQERFQNVKPLTAALYRDATGMYCSVGALQSAPLAPTSSAANTATIDYLRGLDGFANTTAMSHEALLALLESTAARAAPNDSGDGTRGGAGGGVAGLVDFYPWWAAHGESARAGKVYPVHTAPTPATPFQVFFDDNVFPGDEHSIVDLRSAESGEAITDVALHEMFTCKVRPLRAVASDEYFLVELESRVRQQCIALRESPAAKQPNGECRL